MKKLIFLVAFTPWNTLQSVEHKAKSLYKLTNSLFQLNALYKAKHKHPKPSETIGIKSTTYLPALRSIKKDPKSIRIMSFNIRYKTEEINKENNWENRLPLIKELLTYFSPDIICFQEPVKIQIKDLNNFLSPQGYVGFGKTREPVGGLANPIFYNTHTIILLESGDFWLNETKTDYLVGWQAHKPRVCTWGKFETLNKHVFFIYNTHLDDQSFEARLKGAALTATVAKEDTSNTLPAFILGDFNAQEKNVVITQLLKKTKWGMANTKILAKKRYGPTITFPNWNNKSKSIIDHIIINNEKLVTVENYAVIQRVDDKRESDHRALFIDVLFH